MERKSIELGLAVQRCCRTLTCSLHCQAPALLENAYGEKKKPTTAFPSSDGSQAYYLNISMLSYQYLCNINYWKKKKHNRNSFQKYQYGNEFLQENDGAVIIVPEDLVLLVYLCMRHKTCHISSLISRINRIEFDDSNVI